MNIICLDIDDCIFINDSTYAGEAEDALDLLEINLKRLLLIINKWDFKVFITSSWFSILILEENNMDLSEIKDKNYIFLKTNGLIDNPSIYKIRQFMEKK